MSQIIPPYMTERIQAYKENTKNAQHLYNPAAAEIEQVIASATPEQTDEIHTVLHFDGDFPNDAQTEEVIGRARALKGHGLLVRSSQKHRTQ